MKTRIFLAALSCSASLAGAQTAAPPATAPDPADAAATVPRMAYRSVFAATPRGVEAAATAWAQANADVGQFPRGHVDLLKWEERNAPASPPAPPAPHGHHHDGGHTP